MIICAPATTLPENLGSGGEKCFFWSLEVAAVNSYILCSLCREKDGTIPYNQLQYRKVMILELVDDCRRQKERGRPSSKDTAERLNKKQHFIGRKPGKAEDCAVCSNRSKGERKKNTYFCKTCSRKPGLHASDCFELYYTKINYKKSTYM